MTVSIVCPHCQQNTFQHITETSGHCTNLDCPGYMLTLPEHEFMALTPAQLEAYARGHQSSRDLDLEQAAFEARVEALKAAAAERAAIVEARIAERLANRNPDEKLFG